MILPVRSPRGVEGPGPARCLTYLAANVADYRTSFGLDPEVRPQTALRAVERRPRGPRVEVPKGGPLEKGIHAEGHREASMEYFCRTPSATWIEFHASESFGAGACSTPVDTPAGSPSDDSNHLLPPLVQQDPEGCARCSLLHPVVPVAPGQGGGRGVRLPPPLPSPLSPAGGVRQRDVGVRAAGGAARGAAHRGVRRPCRRRAAPRGPRRPPRGRPRGPGAAPMGGRVRRGMEGWGRWADKHLSRGGTGSVRECGDPCRPAGGGTHGPPRRCRRRDRGGTRRPSDRRGKGQERENRGVKPALFVFRWVGLVLPPGSQVAVFRSLTSRGTLSEWSCGIGDDGKLDRG